MSKLSNIQIFNFVFWKYFITKTNIQKITNVWDIILNVMNANKAYMSQWLKYDLLYDFEIMLPFQQQNLSLEINNESTTFYVYVLEILYSNEWLKVCFVMNTE